MNNFTYKKSVANSYMITISFMYFMKKYTHVVQGTLYLFLQQLVDNWI